MTEKIVETKKCKQCIVNFDITDKDLEFYDKISPIFEGKKYDIPSPTLCPECREQRRLSFRNERKLYKRKCDATGKNIISIYRPEIKYSVYNFDFWWSDKWDALDYGKDFDFKKGFFEQFNILYTKVPKRAVMKGGASENCDYVNFVGESKDCYLIFNAANNTKCCYSNSIIDCEDSLDSSFLSNSAYCYSCIDVKGCYNCKFLQDSENCSESSYLYNCKNCFYCFFCVNLENKKYYIENIQYSKEEYISKIQKIHKNIDDFYIFKMGFPLQGVSVINSENVVGNKIYNSSNIKDSFEIYDSEEVSYSSNIFKGVRDCYDTYVAINNCSLLYESHIINKYSSKILFSSDCWGNCLGLTYCTDSRNCKYCFGCSGLDGKQYCILNKQYTKQEYDKLVPKIIQKMKIDGEWGEFFPSSISPFGYNETVAEEYFSLEKEEALKSNFNWSDYEPPLPNVEKIISADKLPENIVDIPDDILNWVIECEVTKKPFRIIEQELEFYRKHNLPIPKRHPDQRHLDRMSLRNPRKLYDRNCEKCGVDIQTTYSPDREEIVYCENCYNKEIY